MYLSFCVVVLSAVFMRLIPHIPNISPIGALALFSGTFVPSFGGFIMPIAAMFLSDVFLGFHRTIPFVYGSFLLIAGIGYFLRKKTSPLKIMLGTLLGSLLFFIITNFGVWITSSMYERNINGLLRCYYMGLPFFRNTIFGDFLYTAFFFIGYKILRLLFVLMLPARRKTARHVGNTV